MNPREKGLSLVVPSAAETLLQGPWLTPACTMAERLHRIEGLGRKIEGYVNFMRQIEGVAGVSDEAKDHAITAFYDKLVLVEKQLSRIHETLRLQ